MELIATNNWTMVITTFCNDDRPIVFSALFKRKGADTFIAMVVKVMKSAVGSECPRLRTAPLRLQPSRRSAGVGCARIEALAHGQFDGGELNDVLLHDVRFGRGSDRRSARRRHRRRRAAPLSSWMKTREPVVTLPSVIHRAASPRRREPIVRDEVLIAISTRSKRPARLVEISDPLPIFAPMSRYQARM